MKSSKRLDNLIPRFEKLDLNGKIARKEINESNILMNLFLIETVKKKLKKFTYLFSPIFNSLAFTISWIF